MILFNYSIEQLNLISFFKIISNPVKSRIGNKFTKSNLSISSQINNMLIGGNELKRNFQFVIGRTTELNNKKWR